MDTLNNSRMLQVHYDGVDRLTGIDNTGYWGFGIYDYPTEGYAIIRANTATSAKREDVRVDYNGDYALLLEYYMHLQHMDAPAHLCTVDWPFKTLARRR
jgi:hypothetical protein